MNFVDENTNKGHATTTQPLLVSDQRHHNRNFVGDNTNKGISVKNTNKDKKPKKNPTLV